MVAVYVCVVERLEEKPQQRKDPEDLLISGSEGRKRCVLASSKGKSECCEITLDS